MCYDNNARPPFPSRANDTARGEDLVLTAADGNRFAAYMAHPSHPIAAQVLIYPDAGGLGKFYKHLTLRFAEVGITALAFDKFGRTAGLTDRKSDFPWQEHVPQVRLETFFADARAALGYLRTEGGSERATFTIGCCMGGTLSLLSGTTNFDLSGVMALYASGMRKNEIFHRDGRSALDQIEEITCPTLGLFGDADRVIPIEEVHALEEKLDKARVEHEIVVYPGAPHGFFEIDQEEFAEMSADAWKRILSFIDVHTAVAGDRYLS